MGATAASGHFQCSSAVLREFCANRNFTHSEPSRIPLGSGLDSANESTALVGGSNKIVLAWTANSPILSPADEGHACDLQDPLPN
jgi:hypothetical protein